MTKIEWTAGDDGAPGKSWNPVVGCAKVSAGCKNCYAMEGARRQVEMQRAAGRSSPYEQVVKMESDFRLPAHIDRPRAEWNGRAVFLPERLDQPLRWRKPRRVFLNSMSDLFHDDITDKEIDRVLAVTAVTPQHTHQCLTKRPARALQYLGNSDRPFAIQRAIDFNAVEFAMNGVVEEWRPVLGWGAYSVSNYGHVVRDGHRLKLREHNGGYASVSLCQSGKPTGKLVHGLVLSAFHRPRREGEETRHRNGVRRDNRLANLSWGTKKQNMEDSARHGTAGVWMKSQASLTPGQVEEIRSLRRGKMKLDTIAARFGSTRQQISAICTGKIFKPAALGWPLPNVHLYVSVEDQATADERIPLLLQTPAAVRGVSAEPLLAPVNLDPYLGTECVHDDAYREPDTNAVICGQCENGTVLDHVIVGGESGPGARPMRLEWVRSIVGQCRAAWVACFVKQLQLNGRLSKDPDEWPEDLRVREMPGGGR